MFLSFRSRLAKVAEYALHLECINTEFNNNYNNKGGHIWRCTEAAAWFQHSELCYELYDG